MSHKNPILIILKPEVFDPALRRENRDVFLPDVDFLNPTIFLQELFSGIVSNYEGPFPITWTEDQIRSQYNQPHHFLAEPGFLKNRVDTLVDLYAGRYAEVYIAYGNDYTPGLLTLRKKEIRKRFLQNPDVAFYSLYHVSDSLLDGEREIAIYENCIK